MSRFRIPCTLHDQFSVAVRARRTASHRSHARRTARARRRTSVGAVGHGRADAARRGAGDIRVHAGHAADALCLACHRLVRAGLALNAVATIASE